MHPLDKHIVLASKSPRRKQILEAAGFGITIKTKEVEEDFPEDMPAEDVAAFLAQKKAHACREFLTHGDVLLAADSVVLLDQTIYGKPVDRDDALRILNELSGQTHQVITGVCLLTETQEKVFSGISTVHMQTLSADEIAYYVDTYKPYDKAGAYAIQEWIGLCKISGIEGTYSNIMGLPMELVYRELSLIK